MKITYLLGSVGNTGGGIVLYKHMEALARQGHEVYLVSPHGRIQWKQGTEKEIFKETKVGYDGIYYYLKNLQVAIKKKAPKFNQKIMSIYSRDALALASSCTGKLLKRWKSSDITIATHSFTAHAAALLSNRTKAFYHMQGYEPWFDADPKFKMVSQLSYHLPLKKMANSLWLREKVSTLSGHKIGLVRPGVDLRIFRPQAEIKVKYSSMDEFIIVSYGDYRLVKGWRESVQAMKRVFEVSRNKIKIRWMVFGARKEEDNLGIPVEFCGYLPHEKLAKLYSKAHLVFIPSWLESFPLQPLESMACGTAVLTTRIGTEDFARHKETAWVVPPRDPVAISDGILYLVKNKELLLKMAENGFREAQKFTWEKSYLELKNNLGLN